MTKPRRDIPSFDLSPSSIRLWNKCRYAWYNRYVLGIKAKVNEYMARGSRAHEALAELALHAMAGRVTRNGPKIKFNWAKEHTQLDFSDTYIIESWWRLQLSLGGADRFAVAGIWDRVDVGDGWVNVIDYKSGKRTSRAKLAHDPATLLYLAAARERWPGHELQIVYHWLKFGTETAIPWTPAIDAEARAVSIRTWAEVRNALDRADDKLSYPASTGGHCGWCDYSSACEPYQRLLAGAWGVKPSDAKA